ncbi:bestrophin family protein [Fluviicola sp.]|uniref:bestrophin family protein n=1 Tax=Fluviicola sp. TaxID=1917219 RepID=UPI003D2B07A4
MHSGKSYHIGEFIIWTRRNIFLLLLIGAVPVVLFDVFNIYWIAIPWTVVALLGTATAFIVGFKNTQAYNRTWEARQIWGAIVNSSRSWGAMSKNMVTDDAKSKELIYRHFAWLTALRYQMRDSRIWETASKSYNKEYRKYYRIPEKETTLELELAKYLDQEEIDALLKNKNRATQLLAKQSKLLRELLDSGQLDTFQYIEMQKVLNEFFDHQGKSERIKNFPYPRQFATINTFFIRLFCFLLPFGMLFEFSKMNDYVEGPMKGHMVWLVLPFSVLISWVFTSLEQVGESAENPFEGSANDVPISQISRTIEIDLREMLGETDLPEPLTPMNNIVL